MKARSTTIALTLLCAVRCVTAATPQDSFNALFGDDVKSLAKTHDRKAEIAFAVKLIAAAKDVSDDPAFQAYLCNAAYDYSFTSPDGYTTAIDAMQTLQAVQPDQKPVTDHNILDLMSKQLRSASGKARHDAAERLLAKVNEVASAQIAADKYSLAEVTLQLGLPAAEALGEDAASDLQAQIKSVQEHRTLEAQLAEKKTQLSKFPHDKTLLQGLVTFILVDLNEPALAKPYISDLGDDPLTRIVNAANTDIANLSDTDALTLADWYKNAAPSASVVSAKLGALQFARAAYERARDAHDKKDAFQLGVNLSLAKTNQMIESIGGKHVPVTKHETIDLLKLVNVNQDAESGNWKRTKDGILSSTEHPALLHLRYKPGAEYDVRFQFARIAGGDCAALILPVKNGQIVWYVGGYSNTRTFIEAIDDKGQAAEAKAAKTPVAIKNGQRYTSLVKVRSDSVAAFIDDAPIMQIKLDGRPMHADPRYAVKTHLGLATWSSQVAFSEVSIKDVTGHGSVLAETDLDDKTQATKSK